jgi:hypothetical protein
MSVEKKRWPRRAAAGQFDKIEQMCYNPLGGGWMGLDLWSKEDIRNILLGVELANAHLASHYGDAEVRAYREGFKAAIAATAVSFGIYPREIRVEVIATQPNVQLIQQSTDK